MKLNAFFTLFAMWILLYVPQTYATDIYCDGQGVNYLINEIGQGEIFFHPSIATTIHGTCEINQPIIIGHGVNNLTIQGDNKEESKIVVVDIDGVYSSAFKIEGATGITITNLTIENGNPGISLAPFISGTETVFPLVNVTNVTVLNSQGSGLVLDGNNTTFSTSQPTQLLSSDMCASGFGLCEESMVDGVQALTCTNTVANICDADFIGSTANGIHSLGAQLRSCNPIDDNVCQSTISNNQIGMKIENISFLDILNSNISISDNDSMGLSITTSAANILNHSIISISDNGDQSNTDPQDLISTEVLYQCDETSQINSATEANIQTSSAEQALAAEQCLIIKPPVDSELIPIPWATYVLMFFSFNLLFIKFSTTSQRRLWVMLAILLFNPVPNSHALDVDCNGTEMNYIFKLMPDGFPDEPVTFDGTCLIDQPIHIVNASFAHLIGKNRDTSRIEAANNDFPAINILRSTGVKLENFSIHNGNPGVIVVRNEGKGSQVDIFNVGFLENKGTGLCVLDDPNEIKATELGPQGLRQLTLCNIDLPHQAVLKTASTTTQTQQLTSVNAANVADSCPAPESLSACFINKWGILECNNNVVNICNSDFIKNEAGMLSIGSYVLSCNNNSDSACATDSTHNLQYGMSFDFFSQLEIRNSQLIINENGTTGLTVYNTAASLKTSSVISSSKNATDQDVFIDTSVVLCDETSQIVSESPANDKTGSNCFKESEPEPSAEKIPLPVYSLLLLTGLVILTAVFRLRWTTS